MTGSDRCCPGVGGAPEDHAVDCVNYRPLGRSERRVDLDWADDADPSGSERARELGLRAEVLQAHGPAGGWPIIRFSGDARSVEALVLAYANGDVWEARHLLGDEMAYDELAELDDILHG